MVIPVDEEVPQLSSSSSLYEDNTSCEFMRQVTKLRLDLREVYSRHKEYLTSILDEKLGVLQELTIANDNNNLCIQKCKDEIQMTHECFAGALLSSLPSSFLLCQNDDDDGCGGGAKDHVAVEEVGCDEEMKHKITIHKEQLEEAVMDEVIQYYQAFLPYEHWIQSNIIPTLIIIIKKMISSDKVLLDAYMTIYRSISNHFQTCSPSTLVGSSSSSPLQV